MQKGKILAVTVLALTLLVVSTSALAVVAPKHIKAGGAPKSHKAITGTVSEINGSTFTVTRNLGNGKTEVYHINTSKDTKFGGKGSSPSIAEKAVGEIVGGVENATATTPVTSISDLTVGENVVILGAVNAKTHTVSAKSVSVASAHAKKPKTNTPAEPQTPTPQTSDFGASVSSGVFQLFGGIANALKYLWPFK